jgi:hypothetical protein
MRRHHSRSINLQMNTKTFELINRETYSGGENQVELGVKQSAEVSSLLEHDRRSNGACKLHGRQLERVVNQFSKSNVTKITLQ